jgi:hypothetical protein
VLGLSLGAMLGWLFVGAWTKLVVSLELAMALKLYRDVNRAEVSEAVDRIGKKVPRRLSVGAGAVGRMAAQGARMAMDLDFFSPARARSTKGATRKAQ